MTDTTMLRSEVAKKGLKYQFIAMKLGITSYGLQKKIENQTEFKASEISKLTSLLNLTQDAKERIFFAQ